MDHARLAALRPGQGVTGPRLQHDQAIGELEAACFDAYLTGLLGAGWSGREQDVRLGVVASCVKYTWLLPLMLEQAGNDTQRAYHQPADAQELYRRRGLTLAHLVEWCDEALARIGR